MVYGWITNNNLFECCACHDEYDYLDTRIFIDSNDEIQGIWGDIDRNAPIVYIIEYIERPDSPNNVIDF